MKVAVVQCPYSVNFSDSEKLFQVELELMDQCDESLDLIIFPESCDVPALPSSYEERMQSRMAYTTQILQKAIETAKRCNAIVFVNGIYENDNGGRNTTFAKSSANRGSVSLRICTKPNQ